MPFRSFTVGIVAALIGLPAVARADAIERGSHAITANGGLAAASKVDNWLTGLREPTFVEGSVGYDYRLRYVAFGAILSVSTYAVTPRAGVTFNVPIGPIEIGVGGRVGPAWALDTKYISGTGFHLEARAYALANVVGNLDVGVEGAYFIESFRTRRISESDAAAFVLPIRIAARFRF